MITLENNAVLDRFAVLVDKLTSTMGRLEKESYLRDVENDAEVLEILKFLFDPYIVTGISDKKLGKFIGPDAPIFAVPLIATTDFLPVLDYFKKNNTGRDEDVRHLVCMAAALGHVELVYSIIKRDLKLGIQNTTLNKVFGDGFVPKFDVMLAESYADNADFVVGKEFIITEKLDGVRCILIFNPSPAFFSRNGKPILDLVELTDQVQHLPKQFVYDGELLLENSQKMKSDDLYRATVKVTNIDGQKRGLYFNIFDMIAGDETPAIDRKRRIGEILDDLHERNLAPNLKSVTMHYIGNDTEEISKWCDKFSQNGGEGIMLNIADAPHEAKRTKYLLKVKQFNTADVLVMDIEEGAGANRGKLGAVIIKFLGPDGKEYNCRVGSGFKQSEREEFFKKPELIKGKIIEIGYFELSRNQNDENYSLRFPTFKHLRNDKTEISMH